MYNKHPIMDLYGFDCISAFSASVVGDCIFDNFKLVSLSDRRHFKRLSHWFSYSTLNSLT
ncbi:hypothetical protein Plhal304r1_c005g0022181 [Plasmopara halstedii]